MCSTILGWYIKILYMSGTHLFVRERAMNKVRVLDMGKSYHLPGIMRVIITPTTSYTNANLWFFETIFFKNAHWFYMIFSRPVDATNQFWGSFESSEFCYCRRILIFKEILYKISLNLSLKLGTFCKFLSVLFTYKSEKNVNYSCRRRVNH